MDIRRILLMLTSLGVMLPSLGGATTPSESGDGWSARVGYAVKYGAEHPGPASDALLGALVREKGDDLAALVAAIDAKVCRVRTLAALCRETPLGARLAELRPAPAAEPDTKGAGKPAPPAERRKPVRKRNRKRTRKRNRKRAPAASKPKRPSSKVDFPKL